MKSRRALCNLIFFIVYAQLSQCACVPYIVTHYHVVDNSRTELYPHNFAHPYREFMMHVWIPVIQERHCPLILFSHGLGDNFNGMTYTHLCQFCASQGYIVVSVSHTYACKPIQFPDGRRSDYLFPAPMHYQSSEHMFDHETDLWVDDMLCALDECKQQHMNAASLLYDRIDFSRIGVMGHSLGGTVAIQLARKDNRMEAVINLDGPLYGKDMLLALGKPLMIVIGSCAQNQTSLFSGAVPFHKEFVWRWYFNQTWLPRLNAFISAQHNDCYKITIDNIVHTTFSDELPDPQIVPWIVDFDTAHTMIHAYVGAFFDRYLKKIDDALPILQAIRLENSNILTSNSYCDVVRVRPDFLFSR